ncbi:MAG: polysaccharide biosynthesis C-terminal domain-containing protein [Nitrospirales bacterium]|nr:polysaccharide biosynthesis C-terminal domain-containing protein [Nitrospira sp.]MDR4502672.1 polysaccharide biosynthesis C-terminal domain-containing protein [Nitrospirales bacterium]
MTTLHFFEHSLRFFNVSKTVPLTKEIFSVLRAGGIVMVLQIIGLGLAFLSQIFFARWMGVHEYGVYTYVLAWAILFSVPAAAGLPLTSIRYIADGLVHANFDAVTGIVKWSVWLTISIGIVITATATGIIYGLNIGYDLAYPIQLSIAFAIVPLLALLRVQSGIFRGFGWPAWAHLPDPVLRNFFLICIFFLVWAQGMTLTAQLALVITVGVFVVLNALQMVIYRQNVPSAVLHATPSYEPRKWLKTSLPLLLVAGFQVIVERTDLIMLGMLQDTQDVSVYFACSRVANLILIVLTAFSVLSASKIAALFSVKKLHELQIFVMSLLRWIFWPSLGVGMFLIIFGTQILSLFGDAFVTGYDILLLLIACQFINAIVGPVLLLLNMTGQERQSAKVFAWSCLLNIVLNGLLIPKFSAIGAAIATGITIVFWNIWLVIIVKKQLGIVCFPFNPFVNPLGKSQ